MNYPRLTAALACCWALLATPVFGQWSADIDQNMLVRDVIDRTEANPRVAAIAAGGTYIAWWEADANRKFWLHLQRLNAQGRPQWGKEGVTISPAPAGNFTTNYDLQTDAAGNALLVYPAAAVHTSTSHLLVQKINPAGDLLWGPAGASLFDTAPATGGTNPHLAITPAQEVVVAWMTYVPTADPTGSYICLQKLSTDGKPQWAEPTRLKAPSLGNLLPSHLLAAGPDEGVLITYRRFVKGPNSYLIYMQRIAANGALEWAAPTQITTAGDGILGGRPLAVSDGDGGAFVAVQAAGGPDKLRLGVYVQHVTKTGARWNTTGVAAAPGVASTLQTQFAKIQYNATQQAVWVAYEVFDPYAPSQALALQKLQAADGTRLLGEAGFTLIPQQTVKPNLLGFNDTGHDLVLALHMQRFVGEAGAMAALRLTYEGQARWADSPRLLTTDATIKSSAVTTLLADESLAMVWEDYRQGMGVYAQNILADGTLGNTVTAATALAARGRLELFPNPAAAPALHWPQAGRQPVVIRVVDAVGRTMKQETLSATATSWVLWAPELPAGTYIVHATIAGQPHTVRWLKN
ncbi:T9SS type A sorting domain-containing protein [Hymenobacter lutimineralis]|uniref:T9SS type A sorting domain-containing protein n=1 Tax=Hymenobacter lutimineralis TaxID=2606448 RepID=A0A5D6VGG5_9BACT|nr:T9SS type A sorting domain-containing protein [Hymenobacter lutimineralis]TYZ14367.1 T9SS type A sorting domain-containing protein [Hymenobacter lutimineralis]